MKVTYDCTVTKRYTDLNDKELLDILKVANEMRCNVEIRQECDGEEYEYFQANGKYEVCFTEVFNNVDRDKIESETKNGILYIEEYEDYLKDKMLESEQ